MLRDNLILGDIPYLVEYFPDNELNSHINKNYIMLRKYDIINNVANDTDIYFIENTIYENYYNNLINKRSDKNVVFPITNNKNLMYSYNIFDFVVNGTKSTIKYEKTNNRFESGQDVYELVDSSFNAASIPCDIIKIYKPHNRQQVNSIIHVTNNINNITFHYICAPYHSFELDTNSEIKIDNNIYCEYIKIYIPCIKELFKDNTVFYKENLNAALKTTNVKEIFSKTVKDFAELRYVPLSLLIEPFFIKEEIDETDNESVMYKVYAENSFNIERNYLHTPLNISMYYYDGIDNTSSYFTQSKIVTRSSISIIDDIKFVLSSRANFDDNGIISLISTFNYPDKEYFKSLIKSTGNEEADENEALKKAYFYINNVNEQEYENWQYNEDLEDDIDDIIGESKINKAGYKIEMARDNSFQSIMYSANYETKNIQDFAFSLNEIFTDWKQFPEILFIRAIFIDRYLHKYFEGNVVTITKEQFKYCINNIAHYRVKHLKDLAFKYTENNNMELNNFNFIDKINCVINRKETSNNNLSKFSQNAPKILYKPIFYKAYDLQNIKLRYGITQKIGINLGDFMTKVETFKLNIDNNQYIETGRNDIYVIFTINTSIFTNVAGVYDIMNQDDEYISSGNFELY